jgi:hypothetical protein
MTTEYRTDYSTDYQPVEFYELLEVKPGSSKQAIDSAYRRMAWQYHPDHNPSAEATRRMQQINAAYSTLKDTRRRTAYDRELRYDLAEYETNEPEYEYAYNSPANYAATVSRRSGVSFRTKVEGLAVLITLLAIGWALWLQNPVSTTGDDTPVTGLSRPNVVSNYPAPVLRSLYYDDFEGAKLADWKLGAGWQLTTRQAYAGITSLWAGGTDGSNFDTTAELLRPLDLTGISYPVLHFRINGPAPAAGRLLVEIAGPGQPFQAIFETQKPTAQWEEISLDLAKFKGAEIKVRFHFISEPGKNTGNSNGYFLDDLRIENAAPGR